MYHRLWLLHQNPSPSWGLSDVIEGRSYAPQHCPLGPCRILVHCSTEYVRHLSEIMGVRKDPWQTYGRAYAIPHSNKDLLIQKVTLFEGITWLCQADIVCRKLGGGIWFWGWWLFAQGWVVLVCRVVRHSTWQVGECQHLLRINGMPRMGWALRALTREQQRPWADYCSPSVTQNWGSFWSIGR